jgi:hypothetical protein
MQTPSFIHDPMHWRRRAEEARVIANQMSEPEARRMMLKTADDYEKLAKRAEQRVSQTSGPAISHYREP